ncbi:MAG: hypothetical protein D6722_25405 [Bacteroidetes bacterium]|nr:MAG: hypothetical protein D6722_25405 [Bacteroidota bacterium]
MTLRYALTASLLGLVLLLAACRQYLLPLQQSEPAGPVYRVLPSPQAQGGDPEAGLAYLTTGDYVGGGFPLALYETYEAYTDTVLRRDGVNAHMLFSDIAFAGPDSVMLVSGSCFTCHASTFRGEVVLGLGNSFSDFTQFTPMQGRLLPWFIRRKVGRKSDEWAAAEPYTRWLQGAFPWFLTDQYGVNPAFRMEEGYASHRDPVTLAYQKQPVIDRFPYNIASDVPPLWHVRKKEALYYNGMGRGDFTKLLMQASTLGIPDTTAARAVQRRFVDVLAWLEALEPPAYPEPVDAAQAARGEAIFSVHCEKCHGTYGARESYPNKIVPLDEVGTDPLYAQYFMQASGLPDWFNKSWFAQSPPAARLQASAGYMAPPLDGVWATAPYLHNGSVPTLAALLDSRLRPRYWARSGDSAAYDLAAVGWQYTEPDQPKGDYVYDTTLPGYGKQGHTFGDTLSASERADLLAYLKTL